jgi:hypothetical protein
VPTSAFSLLHPGISATFCHNAECTFTPGHIKAPAALNVYHPTKQPKKGFEKTENI